MRISTIVVVALALDGSLSLAFGQDTFDEWMRQRVASLARLNLAAEQMDTDKDVEPPSLARGSSLVDETDAPDLIGLAMSFYNATSNNDDKAPVTMTVSAWTLRNAVTHDDPLDPAVYATGGNWRRWSFTVGRELDEGVTGSARVFGAKFLVLNGRDVSSSTHRQRLAELNALLPRVARQQADISAQVEDYLFATLQARLKLKTKDDVSRKAEFLNDHLGDENFKNTVALLTEEELGNVDAILLQRMAADAQLRTAVAAAVAAIRGAPQLAVTYQARLLPNGGANEHRWQAVFDYGPTDTLKLSVNGSFDVRRLRAMDDEPSGRLAVEFAGIVGPRMNAEARAAEILRLRPVRNKSSLTLSGSYEAEWRQDRSMTQQLQTKLTVPIPGLKGLALPISFTYANNPDLIDEHDVRGQVGFTLDFSQLRRALPSPGQ
jgi:hypothetical protein